MADLSRRAIREARAAGQQAEIEYTPAALSYLRRAIRPCIFAYDLVHAGKVVWGRHDILGEVAPFTAADIPREDALRLLMNRIVELLLLEETPLATPENQRTRAYQMVKVIMDLAGSALAFTGGHVPRYQDRQTAFETLLATSADLRSALPCPRNFVEALGWATRCKLEPSDDLLLVLPAQELKSSVSEWARALWLWETRRLLARPRADFTELLEAYVRHEPLRARLRGWAKLWLHPFRPPRTFSIPKTARWALWSSPQQLTYAAALVAFWGKRSEANEPVWQGRLDSLFPVRRPAATNGVNAEAIGDVWRWLVRTN